MVSVRKIGRPHRGIHPDLIVVTVRRIENGWIPMLIVNGHEKWNWQRHGYDRDEAARLAMEMADEQLSRWAGDVDATIEDRTDEDVIHRQTRRRP